jgi:hypothetical protein
MFILVENKISYNLVNEYFNKSFTYDFKIILKFLQKFIWPFLEEALAAPYSAFSIEINFVILFTLDRRSNITK